MNKRNLILALLAMFVLGWVLVKCLATAWIGMKLLPFAGLLLAFVVVGWLWGKFTK